DRTNITVGYPQTNRKIDTGKTLTRWPVFVDHFKIKELQCLLGKKTMEVEILKEAVEYTTLQ
ncbi:hypothetical protein ACRWFE_25735, partial [Escherichia coli]|uniref:hypothetical protein n=1 Tax=Escherichia coli TaxID=562 RepID=UPI003346628D